VIAGSLYKAFKWTVRGRGKVIVASVCSCRPDYGTYFYSRFLDQDGGSSRCSRSTAQSCGAPNGRHWPAISAPANAPRRGGRQHHAVFLITLGGVALPNIG
jgi:hypothetical protein